jgi:hypothetical protein
MAARGAKRGRRASPLTSRREHRVRLSGRVSDQESGQAVLGDHAGSIECVGVDAHDGEVLGDVLCTHTATIRPLGVR